MKDKKIFILLSWEARILSIFAAAIALGAIVGYFAR